MNFIDQFYLVLIYVGSELSKHAHILMGAVLAMTISYLKASKERQQQNWGNNFLCCIFSGIALTGVSVIQKLVVITFPYLADVIIPTSLVVGVVSGFIAWHGADGTIELIKNLKRRDRDDSNKG